MRVVLDISNQEDIAWLENLPKEKKNDTIRNCVTIGRLALENCKMNIDNAKYLEPIMEQFKSITESQVQKALDSISTTRDQLHTVQEELDELADEMKKEVKQNSMTMVECLKSQSSLTEKLLEPIYSRIDKMNTEVEKIFSVKSNSNMKGKLGESIIAQHIQTAFPSYEVINMSQSPHEADYHIHSDFGKILLEIKTYQNTVNKEQLDKFYKDIDRTGIGLAIFLSTTSGIVGKKHIEWEVYGSNKTIILYFPNSTLQLENVVFSFLFLRALVELGINKENTQDLVKSNEEVIELFKMFDTFYLDLLDTIEKQTKVRYQIQTVKNTINKSIDELYKQAFDLELENKAVIEKIYGKMKKKMISYERPLEFYKRMEDEIQFQQYLVDLGCKLNQITLMKNLYGIVQDINTEKNCVRNFAVEKGTKEPKIYLLHGNTPIFTICISKTKIEIVIDLPKETKLITLHPMYESFKNNQIILQVELESMCLEHVKYRLSSLD